MYSEKGPPWPGSAETRKRTFVIWRDDSLKGVPLLDFYGPGKLIFFAERFEP